MNEKLVLENIKLIHKVIKDMGLYYRNEDEYQEFYDTGMIGLIIGAKAYDETKTKPSTFLYKCIHNEIVKKIHTNSMQKRNNKYGKDISIYTEIGKGDNGDILTIFDITKDEKSNIEEEIMKQYREEQLYKTINKLDPIDQDYIKKRYGLFGYVQMSGTDIAKEYNVTKQAVNQRIERIKKKLKKHLEKIKEDL